jgi:hypothetical protein
MPQLDGSFIVNDAFENVDVRFKDDKAFLDYSTLCKVGEEKSDSLIKVSEIEKKSIIIKNNKFDR